MKVTHRYCIFWALLTGILFPLLFGATAIAEPCDPWVARLVSVQGEAMVKRNTQTEWNAIGFDAVLCMGDTLQLGKNSRASVMIAGGGLIRLDQQTTLRFPDPDADNSFWVDLVQGVVHFFSHKPRHLKVLTPFVNGNIEGTEFIVTASLDLTEISVLQGRVRAINHLGELLLSAGQTARAQEGTAPVYAAQVRPEDAVQWALYYPVVSDFTDADLEDIETKAVKNALAAYQQGNPSKALTLLQDIPIDTDSVQLLNFRAGLYLMVGRVNEALKDSRQALHSKPENSEALALQTVIAVTQNRKEEALDLAQQAIEANPQGANGYIAQSFAQQANFQLSAALDSVNTAVMLSPENGVAWSRLAELQLSLGELDQALVAAQKAIEFDPYNAHAQTVLGFAYLTQIKIEPAIQAFHKAIDLDQAAPLPRLGMGLATIRTGKLTDGRRHIEIAASLDSQNALIRSYLGKAYFDEKESTLAGDQYEMAKNLDYKDPTAWFYDALRKQAANRPVEALQDLQKSIELNDNRAVYRSRLLLDQDLAARNASLGRIYSDLGFQQLALVEGWKSVNSDPSNYSAHRFLADSYAALPRHEIARVSELLQAQLLQPININPIQPQLTETNQLFLAGLGPSDPAYNEYTSLFNRNRISLQTDGVIGSNNTIGDDVVISGIWNHWSLNVGQFHYETDGFRENHDQEVDIYNLFTQVNISHKTSLQAEYRYYDDEQGELPLLFDRENFFPDWRETHTVESFRVGLRHSFSTSSNLLISGNFLEKDAISNNTEYRNVLDENGYMVEAQYLKDMGIINLIGGIGYFDIDSNEIDYYGSYPPQEIDSTFRHTNLYFYSLISNPQNITWTFGLSADFFDGSDSDLDTDQLNPKLGFSWDLTQNTTLRAAIFRTFKRSLLTDQTLEPTQVAGFNQFYDDGDAADIWRYGIGVDHKISSRLSIGAEASMRELEEKGTSPPSAEIITYDSEEQLFRTYFYWTPYARWALAPEYSFERFENPLEFMKHDVENIDTHRFALGISFFHPCGFSANLKPTYVDQEGDFSVPTEGPPPPFFASEHGEEQFWTVDASIHYRLPKQLGLISLEAKNLFNESIRFQDSEPSSSNIYPEQVILLKFAFKF